MLRLPNQGILTKLGRRADQLVRERSQLRNRNSVLAPSPNAHIRLSANPQFGIRERT